MTVSNPTIREAADHYIEVMDVRGDDLLKTGKGAAGRTLTETRALFERARPLAVPQERVAFLVDLHVGGDLIDTILIDEGGCRALLGEKPPTRAQSSRYDAKYWRDAARHKEAGRV